MFNWLRGRRLSKEARKKLLVMQARAEEAIIETHVENVLELVDLLDGEIDAERALEEYGEMLPMDEVIAAAVANRVLARSGAPAARRPASGPGAGRFDNVFRDGGR
jgi:hypothetical protein